MKYKKGDIVRIKSNLEELIFDLPEYYAGICGYAGRTARVTSTPEYTSAFTPPAYHLDIDGGKFYFSENWLEPVPEENHPMSTADILREISMLVEIIGLKEFDIQCIEGVINFTMAKNVEE